MAKKMGFSVVGLPHYLVWHLYEPSLDDIRHMEEMEQERKNREKEEKERAERAKKIKEEFTDPKSQWEKDKSDIEGISKKDEEVRRLKEAESAAVKHGSGQGPIAEPDKVAADKNLAGKTPETKVHSDKKNVQGADAAQDTKNTKAVQKSNESKKTKEHNASGDSKSPANVKEGKQPS
jgi:mannan polymerase II complex ANP1 subunit